MSVIAISLNMYVIAVDLNVYYDYYKLISLVEEGWVKKELNICIIRFSLNDFPVYK